jgi:23S rRNA-/tRNA-specific pseudouridylate synthase
VSALPAPDPRIVYRDEQLLVIDKPVGIATTQPEGGASLFTWAREHDPGAPALHPLSRLDLQVSGLVTFARTAHANRCAIEARQQGLLRRAYLGLCLRRPEPDEGDWQLAIGLDPKNAKHRRALAVEAEGPGIKAAHTHYRVHAAAGPLSALDLWPITGRTHQLRVHAGAAGSPLAGDVAYGGERRITLPNGRILTAGRVMLHCAAFRMPHPTRPNELFTLSLAPPADMLLLWASAGGQADALTLAL